MKFRLSIFSFDTLLENPLRLLARPSCVLAAVLLLSMEVSLRLTIPQGHLPRGAFHNGELRLQARQLEQLVSTDIDLMFSGSSVAAANYPPLAFDERMTELGMKNFVSFNAGIRGCNWLCIGPGLESVFLSRATPSDLVLILSPHDFDESNQPVIARSVEFLPSFDMAPHKRHVRNMLSSALWLYGYDANIKSLLTSGDWGFDRSAMVKDRGYVDMGTMRRRRYDWNFVIESDGPIAQAFHDLVENATDRGIRVILLLFTGDSGAQRSFEPDDRAELDKIMARAAANPRVKVLESVDSPFGDDDYIDNLHLSPTAAWHNARRLADQLVMEGYPWGE